MPAAAYDDVPYPDFPFEFTQPGRLAAIAVRHGLTPPDPATARVLELGCGAGGNLLAIAAERPGVRAHGIDVAERPVAAARATARAAGIANATFAAADVRDPGALGEADYVIAHGLYAWVPPDVREAVMALIGRVLAPDGIAFVSYTAHPGGHVLRALREAALWHVGDVEDPLDRATRAVAYFRALREQGAPYAGALRDLAETSPQAAHHDILSQHWDPVWFADFVAHAGRHGLAYVAEAWPRGPAPHGEQHADVLRGTRFRASLLARATPLPHPDAERLRELRFVRQGSPAAVPFDALGMPPDAVEESCVAGTLVPWVGGPPAAAEPPERPRAPALARFQAARGRPLTTLTGSFVVVDDPSSRALVTLLDGTRDRAAIAADLERVAGVTVDLEDSLRALAARGLVVHPNG